MRKLVACTVVAIIFASSAQAGRNGIAGFSHILFGMKLDDLKKWTGDGKYTVDDSLFIANYDLEGKIFKFTVGHEDARVTDFYIEDLESSGASLSVCGERQKDIMEHLVKLYGAPGKGDGLWGYPDGSGIYFHSVVEDGDCENSIFFGSPKKN